VATKKKPVEKNSKPKGVIGQYVICRTYSAGVFAGRLAAKEGDEVTLNECRRLWSWKANSGVALSGVARSGLASGCKVDTRTEGHVIRNWLELIPCSPAAEKRIREYS